MEGENNKNKEDSEIERDPVFYYSREHRLSRASPAVQAHYESGAAKTGSFRKMFGSMGNKTLLIVIVLMCIVISLTNRKGGAENRITISGNSLAAIITDEEGIQILDITKNVAKKGNAYVGAVDILVYPLQIKAKEGESREIPPVFSHRVQFGPYYPEIFTLSLPFADTEYSVIFRTVDDYGTMRVKVQGTKKRS